MKHRTLNDEALSYYHKHTAEIEIIRHDRSIEPSKSSALLLDIVLRQREIVFNSSCLSRASIVRVFDDGETAEGVSYL